MQKEKVRGFQRKYSVPALAVLFLAYIGWAEGSGEEPWIAKVPSEWTLQDAESILWKSPWVQVSRSRFFNSEQRIRQITFYVRLQSAEPVRLAMAKAFLMAPDNFVVTVGRSDHRQVLELSEEFKLPDEIVVSLIAFPPSIHGVLDELTAEELKERTYLQLGRERRIELKDFVPPARTTFGEAWFRFRRPEVSSTVDRIVFETSLDRPYHLTIKAHFDANRLKFADRLEY